MNGLPCQKAIGKACFKAFPEFARRAIAYRLLHLLIPPDIAKLLPTKLSDPLIAPGVTIPLDAKFPPGTCIVPGCSFPAGWDPDQDPPECAKSAPLPSLAMVAGGANPNVLLAPGPSGPLPANPAALPPVTPTVYWFNEPFDAGLGVFTAYVSGSGTAENISGRCKLRVTDAGGYSSIYYNGFTENFPANYRLRFDLEVSGGVELVYVEIKTGTHRLYYSFYAPVDVYFMIEGVNNHYVVTSYTGSEINWRTDVAGDVGDFYRDNGSIESGMDLRDDAGAPFIYVRLSPPVAPDTEAIAYIENITVVEI